MSTKPIIWICMAIGSATGGYIPALWGSIGISFSSLLFSAFGAIAGVWIGFVLSRD